MVRRDSAPPRIATVDEFRQALLSAESVVYNRASTGIYLDQLFGRLGISEQLKSKTVRYPDAAAVLNHIAVGTRNEIGLGATTVIMEAKEHGVMLVGPLPDEIQNYTSYEATLASNLPAFEPARELLNFLNSATAKKIFVAAGID
jgi:molybdate transport system substrate-binding protein